MVELHGAWDAEVPEGEAGKVRGTEGAIMEGQRGESTPSGLRTSRAPLFAVAALILVGCGGDAGPVDVVDGPDPPTAEPLCTIPLDEIVDGGVGRDGIRSLEDPELVAADAPGAAYLQPSDRVIAVEVDGQPIAVPHNILWWHEIVNFTAPGGGLAVTFCPLTGSSLAFDLGAIGGSELGVSGLLWRNNLIMFDRQTESLWPQMLRSAACGPQKRAPLPQAPAFELTWEAWQGLYPGGLVVSSNTGYPRSYQTYPYGDYDIPENTETLFPHPRYDFRLQPKQRLLGLIRGGDGGVAYSYEVLGRAEKRAIMTRVNSQDAVVLWDRQADGAAAYFASADGQELTFTVNGDRFVDHETATVWDLAGRAVEGPLAGARLEAVLDSYTVFWFAWVTFQPETSVWFPI